MPTRRAGRTPITSELVSTDVVAFKCGHSSSPEVLLSALPTERPSTPRGKRRASPRPAAHATAPPAIRAVSFAAAGVPAPLVAALAAAGITTPFPIQAATLP